MTLFADSRRVAGDSERPRGTSRVFGPKGVLLNTLDTANSLAAQRQRVFRNPCSPSPAAERLWRRTGGRWPDPGSPQGPKALQGAIYGAVGSSAGSTARNFLETSPLTCAYRPATWDSLSDAQEGR